MTTPTVPPPTRRIPLERIPTLESFSLNRILFSVTSSQPRHAPYRVTMEDGKPTRCNCAGYSSSKTIDDKGRPKAKTCSHCDICSDYLFSETGLYESLRLLEAQLPGTAPDECDSSIYRYRGLMALKGEIEQRLGLHRDIDLEEYEDNPEPGRCACGCEISPSHWAEHQKRCRLNAAMPVYYSDELVEDSDPFADDPAYQNHPLSQSLLLEYGGRYAHH